MITIDNNTYNVGIIKITRKASMKTENLRNYYGLKKALRRAGDILRLRGGSSNEPPKRDGLRQPIRNSNDSARKPHRNTSIRTSHPNI